MKKNVTLLLALAMAAVIGGAYVLYDRLSTATEPSLSAPTAESSAAAQGGTDTSGQGSASEGPQYQPAPDFTMEDADGNAYSLTDFLGKPTIVNFWASWCGFCKNQMPYFEDAYLQYGEEINFLMVNLTSTGWDTREKADTVIDEGGYTFPVYYDTEGSAVTAYAIRGIPLSLFIDADGLLRGYAPGALSAELLQTSIDRIYPAE